MTKLLNGARLIVRNAKRYFLTFVIVIGLMICATYLNVQTPKLLGESFNALGQYIGVSIAEKNLNEVNEIIDQDEELTQEERQTIVDKLSTLSEEQKQQILNADQQQIKEQFHIKQVLTDTILLDKQYVLDHQKFNEQQFKYIEDSNLNPFSKQMLKSLQGEQLVSVANNTKDIKQLRSEKYKDFKEFIIKLLLTFISLAIGMSLYTLLFVNMTVKTCKNIRNRLFRKIANLSIRFYDMSNTGDLLSRFTNDIENIQIFLNSSAVQILSSLCMVGGVAIMMWNQDDSSIALGSFTVQKPLFWLIIVFGLLSVLLSSGILKKAQKYVSKQQEKLGALNGFIDESLSGQKEIISYNLKDQTISKFEQYNNDFKDNAFKGQIYSGLLMPIMMGMGFVTLGLMVFTGSKMVIEGIFSVGLLVAFIQYSQQFSMQLASTVAQYNMVELGMSGANRVQEVFDEEEEIVNCANPIPLTNPNSDIEFKHVNFEYLKNKPVLKDINFVAHPGKMIAIVGPTGSGKTTIMNLLNRFYDVTGGKILIDNHNIKEYDLSELRRNIGIVLQESVLFKGTIRENVSFGKNDATIEEVMNACKVANIHEYIMSLEDGYDTQISNDSSVFSTGQKQLISIARTIITDPSILVLDEATSNVDTITEGKIQKAMDAIIKGRTSFVIAHRLKTILKADYILVLKDGEIIETGNHKELLAQNGFYANLYKNQFVE